MINLSGDVSSRAAVVVDDDDDGGPRFPAAIPNDDVAASPPPANPPPKCPPDDAIDSIDGRDPARDDDDDDDDGDATAADDPIAIPSRPDEESTTTTNDDDDGRPDVDPALRRRAAMEANVALEALESMRRVNLELEFVNAIATIATSTRTISPFPVRHDDCTWCQREALRRHVVSCDAAAVADEDVKEAKRRPRGGSRVRRFNGGVGGLFSWNNAGDDDDRDDDDGKSEPVAVEDDSDLARRWSDGIRINRSAFGVGSLSSKRGVVGENDGDDGEVEPVLVKDENSRRLDGSRIRRFNSNVGSFFAKRTAGDENSKTEPVVVKCENPRRLDGSRIRSFNSNVGSFFSRNKAGDDGKSAETTTQSRVDGDGGKLFFGNDASDDIVDDGKSEEATKENDAGNIDGKSEATQPHPNNSDVGSVSDTNIGDNNDEEPVGIDDDKAKPDRTRAHRFDSNVSSLKSKSTQTRPPPLRNIMQKVSPCLTCGHPTCPRHSSSAFSKKNIPMCQLCAYLFELDFIVDMIASAASSSDFAECRRRVNEMVDCYDRAVLLLSYMVVYAEDVASALEAQAARSNKIGAGSGATSIVSSIAGIVGCGVLIFVGHGVPLLIASLVVSGGATAAQTGDEVVKYFSEPNRLAERMVALHGMATSLLRVKDVLSHVLLKSQLRPDGKFPEVEDEEGSARREELAGEIKALLDKHNVAAGASSVGNGSKFIGRGTRYFGRVCSTAAFIPVAGGLLSAATIYFEGNELKRTLSRISEGNPCAKAEQVRSIADELDMLPESSLVLEECRLVFELAQKEKTGNSSSAFADINEFEDGCLSSTES